MSTVTNRIATPSTLNVSSYASGAFTPAVGDLLVAFIGKTASVNDGSLTDSQGGTWTLIRNAGKVASADTLQLFVRNQLIASASSMTVTYDCTGDAATGCIIQVASVAGMFRTGASAVSQNAAENNQAAGGTPAPVFAFNCQTGNPTLGAVFNATNPATMTPPASWTEQNDTGYSTPGTGQEYVSRDSGFTGTTITWGSTSGTAFCDIIVELDTTTFPTIDFRNSEVA
ncbi:MAG TPA: hypothetical protein VGQ24_10630 [Gemmatimonadales bacterium]|jgi:hypothetical protein|nr:hypothetical protein [Gemmatimonadales bacterium]